MSEDRLLTVESLSARYRKGPLVLRDVSLEVGRGSAVAIVGLNGAGKSTLLRAASGVLGMHGGELVNGSIDFDGLDATNTSSRRIVAQGAGIVPEGRLVFQNLTVEENLRVAGPRNRKLAADRIEAVMELFPALRPRKAQLAGSMSGGEQQMIALGRALMSRPRLLLLDEVSLGLAPKIVSHIFAQLREVQLQFGTALLIVEQNVPLALQFADYAYVLDRGQIVMSDTPSNLLADDRLREVYLGPQHTEVNRSETT